MTVLSIASSWLLAFVAVAVVAVISSSLDNVFVSVVRVNAWSTTPPTKQRQQHSSFSSSSLDGVGIGIGRRRRRKSSLYSKDKILLKDTVIVVDSNNNEGEDEGSSSSSSSREPLSSTTTTARSSSSSSSNTVSEFDRAFELAGITWNEFIYPVGQRLLCDSDSDSDSDDDIKSNGDWDWDEFWELELLTATTSSQSNTYTNNMTIAEQFTQYLERCGATYVKFGQALSSRPDIVPRSLAIALSKLQDDMDILDNNNNNNNNNDFNLDTADGAREILRKEWIASASAVAVDNGDNNTSISTISTTLPLPYFENESEMEKFLNTLSVTPVAAASIGVVYSGILPPSLSSSIVTGVDSKKGKGKTKSKPQKVAIKIQRPNVISTVEKDAKLLKTVAKIIQSIPANKKKNSNGGGGKFIQTNVTGAVDEFMSRLHEELDYYNEADNLELFSKLYSHRRPRPQRQKRRRNKSKQDNNDSDDADDADNNIASGDVFENNNVRVVVPEVYRNLCTDKVLVMEWIDGIKLVDLQRNQRKQQLTSTNTTTTSSSSSSDDSHDNNDRGDASNEKINKETLDLINQGIDCTLSQLLDTGILHADPHGGNIFRVRVDDSRRKSKDSDDSNDSYRLGYIDFGMLSTIPTKVQDGLICAVCQLIFAKNVTAVGELFNELMLLPKEVLNDPSEALALGNELEFALSSILVYNTNDANNDGLIIPTLRFDKLLDVLTRLVPRFQFQLPPYFLNNARALATLEGMAREVNPQFNILHNLYPYAISRLFSNPTSSEVVYKCLKSLIENSSTQKLDIHKLQKLLEDASYYSGYKKRKVVNDIMKSKNGFSLVRRLIREQTYDRLLILLSSSRRGEKKRIKNEKRKRKEEQLSLQKQQQLQRSSSSAAAAWMRTTRRRRLRLRLPLLDRVADSFRL